MEGEGVLAATIRLIVGLDGDLLEIIFLSLQVSLTALTLAAVIGLPTGAALAVFRFPGRAVLVTTANTLMGLPPVVVGLAVFLLLSRAGPLGDLGLLFTPSAMILAQTVLILPIIVALTRQAVGDHLVPLEELLRSLRLAPWHRLTTALAEARLSLVTVLLAGLGRAMAEVGAVMMVGGNINHHTRVMTTAIALETSRGRLALALALGLVLLLLVLLLNGLAAGLKAWANGRAPVGR